MKKQKIKAIIASFILAGSLVPGVSSFAAANEPTTVETAVQTEPIRFEQKKEYFTNEAFDITEPLQATDTGSVMSVEVTAPGSVAPNTEDNKTDNYMYKEAGVYDVHYLIKFNDGHQEIIDGKITISSRNPETTTIQEQNTQSPVTDLTNQNVNQGATINNNNQTPAPVNPSDPIVVNQNNNNNNNAAGTTNANVIDLTQSTTTMAAQTTVMEATTKAAVNTSGKAEKEIVETGDDSFVRNNLPQIIIGALAVGAITVFAVKNLKKKSI